MNIKEVRNKILQILKYHGAEYAAIFGSYARGQARPDSDIESFTRGMEFAAFRADIKTQLAVTRELEIIGEAAKRLSEEFKDKHGDIPWRKIAGMRDFLIHDYMDVDMKEVWKAATEDIAELKQAIV